ncbi:MAG: phosphotransferase enzyme family protein [Aggregatilineales bacterium]
MQTEAGVSYRTLTTWLQKLYALDIQAIRFFPQGECAWNYLVLSQSSERYILKLMKAGTCGDAPFSMPVITTMMALYYDFGITQMTPPPLRATSGEYINTLQGYTAVLLPFVDGKNVFQQDSLAERQQRMLGALMATLHNCKLQRDELPPMEDFSPHLIDDLKRILREANYPTQNYSVFQVKLLKILKKITPRIVRLMHAFSAIQQKMTTDTTLPDNFVVCHGDPSGGNVIITPDETVSLIDMDGLVFAPPERDMIHIMHYEAAMESYTRIRGDFSPADDLLRFYALKWDVQEIVDYGSRLLFQNHSRAQNKHDVMELVKHLKERKLLI